MLTLIHLILHLFLDYHIVTLLLRFTYSELEIQHQPAPSEEDEKASLKVIDPKMKVITKKAKRLQSTYEGGDTFPTHIRRYVYSLVCLLFSCYFNIETGLNNLLKDSSPLQDRIKLAEQQPVSPRQEPD